jgi:hypothetical protein
MIEIIDVECYSVVLDFNSIIREFCLIFLIYFMLFTKSTVD